MEPNPGSSSRTDLFLRGISLNSRNLRINITDININWNLLSPDTDKIVDLSREKILSHKKQFIHDKFYEIYQKALGLFIKELRKIQDVNSNIKFILDLEGKSYFENHQILISDSNDSKLYKLPGVKDKNNEILQMSYKDFFEQDRFLVLSDNIRSDINDKMDFTEIVEKINFEKLNDTIPIICNSRYYKKYLLNNYLFKEIVLSESHGISNIEVYLLTNKRHKEFTGIKVEEKDKKQILRMLKNDRYRQQRGVIYAIEPYAEKLAIKEVPIDFFNVFPEFAERAIISPFNHKNNDKIEKMFPSDLEKKEDEKRKEIIKGIVTSNISSILDTSLVNWINENSINHEKYKKEDIIDSYIELITDYYLHCR